MTLPKHQPATLEEVRVALRYLYRSLMTSRIDLFCASVPIGGRVMIHQSDPNAFVNHIVRLVARHYSIPTTRLRVCFRENLGSAGRVSFGENTDFLVEIDGSLANRYSVLATVIAHELTHVFLKRERIEPKVLKEIEILTDVTASYLGLGLILLNSLSIPRPESGKPPEYYGYITPTQVGYLVAKRCIRFDEALESHALNQNVREQIREGRRVAAAERRCAPLGCCGFIDKWRYRRARSRFIRYGGSYYPRSAPEVTVHFEKERVLKVIFGCPICTSRLRLPIGQKVEVTCQNCLSRFDCQT